MSVARHELDTGLPHQVDTPVNQLLVELHVRNAVHQQSADSVRPLIDGHGVAREVQLFGRGEPGRTRADDGNRLAGAFRRAQYFNPAFFETTVNDRVFDILDRYGRIVDAEHAGAFAGCRTHAAGKLGKVVGLVQAIERLLPAPPVDEVVPLGNQVVDRATRVRLTKRHTAIHAARALALQALFRRLRVDLAVILQALVLVTVGNGLPRVLHESGWLAHLVPPTNDE